MCGTSSSHRIVDFNKAQYFLFLRQKKNLGFGLMHVSVFHWLVWNE